MKQNVTLAEVINAGIDAHLGELHTLLVGRVEAVNAAARKVDVRLATVRVLADEHGTPLIEEMPILRQVPIGALRAGAARIDMPIATGHWVCVLFFEDNIGKWLAGGGVSVSPADVERHGLSGALAVPLLYPDTQTKTLPALSSTDIVIAIAGGPQLKVKLSEVEVIGNLKVTGNVSANGEVTATAAATPVRLSTHYHNTAMGPSAAPTKPS